MKDIPIIVELVIIGFEVMAWILLLVFSVFGYQWVRFDFVNQWATQLSFGLLGLGYMFGLIFDKAISSLPFRWIVGGSAASESADAPTPLAMRMQALAKDPDIYHVLQQHINQHRLVRSTVFNFALISLTALLFVGTQVGFNLRLLVVLIFLSVLFTGLTLFTGRQSARTLMLELQYASEALEKRHAGPEKTERK
ncbi:MAG TPA: hypothetical protein VH188_02065 [Chthoniobacterales bacterium]|jgi:hypothetical protein|nr:hypothetical protein [Chthoniobacterales bacterium]